MIDKGEATHSMRERSSSEDLLEKLEIIGSGKWFLWKIFVLCMIPSVLNGLHLTSSVYLAEVPEHWCHIPELVGTNWTNEQIRTISSPTRSNQSSCVYYNWNYKLLSEKKFEEALEYISENKKPEVLPCYQRDFAPEASSVVINYDLVCERTALKSMIQVSLSIGKFVGALFFGVLSDKYGRRLSFLMGCILYVVSGPTVALSANYSLLIAGRVGLGAACSAIYHSAYVILSEIASKRRRASLGILYNMSYPIGQMIVPLVAYLCREWRVLQIIISVPSIFVFTIYWFLPESPRWLILKGRKTEAAKIIDKEYAKWTHRGGEGGGRGGGKEESLRGKPDIETKSMTEFNRIEIRQKESAEDDKNLNKQNHNIWKKLYTTVNQFGELLKHFELRNRLVSMFLCWGICSLSYYALALNVDNFLTDRYLYGFLTGLVEAPSYILPLPLLKYLGRRHTSIILFSIGGFGLVAILFIPREQDLFILIVASIGRLCASAVFAVVIIHTTELFPTLLRNTAIGCCSTGSHIGSMSAPFIVDLLGAYAWYIPSTVCGGLTLLAGTMMFLMPETKNKPLPDTIDEIIKAPKSEKMGLHQLCR